MGFRQTNENPRTGYASAARVSMTPEQWQVRIGYSKSGPAGVFHVGNLPKADLPKLETELPFLGKLLDKIGLTSKQLTKLLSLEFEQLVPPRQFSVYNSKGEKTEEVLQRQILTTTGFAEVSDVEIFPPAVDNSETLSLHLRTGRSKRRGFEVIYILRGEAELAFPEKVTPVGEVYGYEESMYDSVSLFKGNLIIVPAPTANGWVWVNNLKFRYICQPPWNSRIVQPVFPVNQ